MPTLQEIIDRLQQPVQTSHQTNTVEQTTPTSSASIIESLRERAKGYNYFDDNRDFIFRDGDIVAIRANTIHKYQGQPGIVIQTEEYAEPNFDQEVGTPHFGMRPNVRVLLRTMNNFGDVSFAAYWFDAGDLEPYTDTDPNGITPPPHELNTPSDPRRG